MAAIDSHTILSEKREKTLTPITHIRELRLWKWQHLTLNSLLLTPNPGLLWLSHTASLLDACFHIAESSEFDLQKSRVPDTGLGKIGGAASPRLGQGVWGKGSDRKAAVVLSFLKTGLSLCWAGWREGGSRTSLRLTDCRIQGSFWSKWILQLTNYLLVTPITEKTKTKNPARGM